METKTPDTSATEAATPRWFRWAVLAPTALALRYCILYVASAVDGLLGGYFEPWSYKVAFLGFAFLAAFAPVMLAAAIAPSYKKRVAIVAGAVAVAWSIASINPIWPIWYWAVEVACVIAGVVIANVSIARGKR
jgi:hypothetical protein